MIFSKARASYQIIFFVFLTSSTLSITLPARADNNSGAGPIGEVKPNPSPADPFVRAPVFYTTNRLPDRSSADSEDTPGIIAAPIQKVIVVGRDLGRISCCGTNTRRIEKGGIRWRPLILQELLFVGVEHGFRLATEPKTRRELDGPLFADWAKIIGDTQWNRWTDGDKIFTSYVAHPAEGAVAAWIYRQNDTGARYLEQDFRNPVYRAMLLKSFAVATLAAVLWKIGPVSEATIGHVGLYPTVDKRGLPVREGNRTGLNDYVTNEAVGIPLMIFEDWLDKHLAQPLEGHSHHPAVIDTIRILTSPTRSFANLMSFQRPWSRENRN